LTPTTYNFPELYEGDTFNGLSITARESDGSQFSISSINRSGNTATVVTSAAHGLSTSNLVKITGANEINYNQVFVVTVINTTTFTFTVLNEPATPATGIVKGQKMIPIDLTNVAIKMEIRQSETAKNYLKQFIVDSGITKTDAVNGVFSIDAFIADLPATNYFYDLQFTYNSGVVATYLKGKIAVVNEVTSNG
jgi:hypothetical protein